MKKILIAASGLIISICACSKKEMPQPVTTNTIEHQTFPKNNLRMDGDTPPKKDSFVGPPKYKL